jgi:hypothetical protein
MHLLTGWIGMAMLVLAGIALVLGLVMFVLYEVRWIVRNSRQILGDIERSQFFEDVPPRTLKR